MGKPHCHCDQYAWTTDGSGGAAREETARDKARNGIVGGVVCCVVMVIFMLIAFLAYSEPLHLEAPTPKGLWFMFGLFIGIGGFILCAASACTFHEDTQKNIDTTHRTTGQGQALQPLVSPSALAAPAVTVHSVAGEELPSPDVIVFVSPIGHSTAAVAERDFLLPAIVAASAKVAQYGSDKQKSSSKK